MTDFNTYHGHNGELYRRSVYDCEKLSDTGQWVKVSGFAEPLDEKRLQRHARAMGGELRLRRGEKVVRAWRNGVEVWP